MRKTLLTLFVLLPFFLSAQIYVDVNVSGGSNDGSSWANAYSKIQDAIDAAQPTDSIWVAEGIYLPTRLYGGSVYDLYKTFFINKNVHLFGGFQSGDTHFSDRDHVQHTTHMYGVISGTRVFHVLTILDVATDAVVDGFLITKANLGGVKIGGTNTLRNCVIDQNNGSDEGGGIIVTGDSPNIVSCTISNNTAAAGGGAAVKYTIGGGPSFTDCTFLNNTATSYNGGGIRVYGTGTASFTACTFEGNVANVHGGAIMNENYSSIVVNGCTFINNTGVGAGAIYNAKTANIYNSLFYENQCANASGASCLSNSGAYPNSINRVRGCTFFNNSSHPTITVHDYGRPNLLVHNSILRDHHAPFQIKTLNSGNSTLVGHTIIKGGYAGSNNMDIDPMFVDTANNDYQLHHCSPAIGAGLNSMANGPNDAFGNPRVTGGLADIGAHEHPESFATGIIYVNSAATGDQSGCSWNNAKLNLQDAIDAAAAGASIWVAEGTYQPTFQNGATQQDKTFYVDRALSIYGGFQVGDYQLSDQDTAAHPTILSGDFVTYKSKATLTIVNASGARISGFMIRDASGTGGVYMSNSDVDFEDCVIAHNTGNLASGVHVDGANSTFTNCTLRNNYNGAAIYAASGITTIRNCEIIKNTSPPFAGAIRVMNPATVNLYESLIANNFGTSSGGILNEGRLHVFNSLFLENQAVSGNEGNAITMATNGLDTYVHGSTFYKNGTGRVIDIDCSDASRFRIYNSILWNNGATEIYENVSGTPEVEHCIVKGGYAGLNNLDADPLFQDAVNNDFRIRYASPALNAGLNSRSVGAKDMAGRSRQAEGTVDIGAYEFVLGTDPCGGLVYYVNSMASGANAGCSWTDAFTDLQSALDQAEPGSQIWVAEGTYLPTRDSSGNLNPTDARTKTFYCNTSAIKIYGGFVGTESLLSERDWRSHETILSGDLGVAANDADNSYHVVYIEHVNATFELNGFTIQRGNATNGTENRGGGIYNDGAGSGNSSNPKIRNCVFRENRAERGGAFYNNGDAGGIANPHFSNCRFTENTADDATPVFYNYIKLNGNGTVDFVNCVFDNNQSTGSGSLIYTSGNTGHHQIKLINCTVSGNTASNGELFRLAENYITASCALTIKNSILDGSGTLFNTPHSNATMTVSNSLMTIASLPAIVTDGGNNQLSALPGFVDADLADFRIVGSSVAVNAGDNAATTESLDIGGRQRMQEGTIDMGAFEYTYGVDPCRNPVVFVKTDASGLSNGCDWANAYTSLQEALENVTSGQQIWVASGTYVPTKDIYGNSNPTYAREKTFFINQSGIAIYGGFAGTESQLSERNWKTNPTILSADQGSVKSAHVLFIRNVDSTTVVDGFTIRDGSANNSLNNANKGGGIYMDGIGSGVVTSPRIRHCILTNNHGSEGGAVYTYATSGGRIAPSFSHCEFVNNTNLGTATIYNKIIGTGLNQSTYNNCLFASNRCLLTYCTYSGAMYNIAQSPPSTATSGMQIDINNCTFYGENGSKERDLIWVQGTYNAPVDVVVTNSILANTVLEATNTSSSFGSLTFRNCLLPNPALPANSTDGGNNLLGRLPNFVDAANDDFQLGVCSPAINSGDSTLVTDATDLAGNDRVQFDQIDMGAFELTATELPVPGLVYVDVNATGLASGCNWADAFTNLQDALDIATDSTEIWVAAGTYLPTKDQYGLEPSDERNKLFICNQTGLKIYGGFVGTETQLSERDWQSNPTILSGDLGSPGDNSDNSYLVVRVEEVDSTFELDGFTITGGNAIVSGGGMHIGGFSSNATNPIIRNCTFTQNTASRGAAIYIQSQNGGTANPKLINCVFTDNTATSHSALAYVSNYHSTTASLDLINCLIYNNHTPQAGGLVYQDGDDGHFQLNLTNCTLFGNTALYNYFFRFQTTGAGICDLEFKNSIINQRGNLFALGNSSHSANATHSLFIDSSLPYNLTDGGGNLIGAFPDFIDTSNYDLRLSVSSVAINSGNNAYAAGIKDVGGRDRVQNTTVDMGAYEFTDGIDPCNSILFVNAAATGANTGCSWTDAYTDLQDALDNKTNTNEVWVAAGTYVPTKDTSGNVFPTDSLTKTFFFNQEDFKIYGGFAGTETSLSERDWEANPTILSGEQGSAKSYHVVLMRQVGDSTLLDGFTIRDGRANSGGGQDIYGGGVYLDADGAGVVTSPIFRNCLFTENYAQRGGAVIAYADQGGVVSPTYRHCRFIANTASVHCGGVYNLTRGDGTNNSVYSNCVFASNVCNYTGDYGIAIAYNAQNNLGTGWFNNVISNCTFYDNNAQLGSGAVIAARTTGSSGRIDLAIDNSIFQNDFPEIKKTNTPSGTIVFKHSLFKSTSMPAGGTNGGGNVFGRDALFVDGAAGDFQLEHCSPAVNTGNNALVTDAMDLAGETRIQLDKVDMGAYELTTTELQKPSLIYVDANADGGKTGCSWENAYTDLQDALNGGEEGDTIWVAKGTYYPSVDDEGDVPTDSRDKVFRMGDISLHLYGGFAGTETLFSERDLKANPAILSGDIGTQGDHSDNCAHVVLLRKVKPDFTLDGFSIQDGYASTGQLGNFGGGMLIYAYEDTCRVTIRNCVFKNNRALNGGGLVMYGDKDALIDAAFFNCSFNDNLATTAGGAILNTAFRGNSFGQFTNCLFMNNEDDIHGGLIRTTANYDTARIDLINCSAYNNSSTSGASLSVNTTRRTRGESTLNWTNSVLWDSGTLFKKASRENAVLNVRNSLVKNASLPAIVTDGGNNILNQDPLFFEPDSNDLRVLFLSPVLNAGDNAALSDSTDYEGMERKIGTVDIGAYEIQLPCTLVDTSDVESSVAKEYTDGVSGWTHYISQENQLLVSIFKNGQDFGSVGDAGFDVEIVTQPNYGTGQATDLSGADYVNANQFFAMNRYWNVNPVNQPGDTVIVRFYYTEKDINDLKGSMPTLNDSTQLVFFKLDGTNNPHALDAGPANYHEYMHGTSTTADQWVSGNFMGFAYAEYKVTSFSGGGLGFSSSLMGSALPVEWADFEVYCDGNEAVIEWATSTETNTAAFEVQRSLDAQEWETITQQEAAGFAQDLQEYSVRIPALPGKWLYRIQQADLDGKISFSEMKLNDCQVKTADLKVFPNPTGNSLNLRLNEVPQQSMRVQLSDQMGGVLLEQNFAPDEHARMRVSLEKYPAGIYNLSVWVDGVRKDIRVTKINQ